MRTAPSRPLLRRLLRRLLAVAAGVALLPVLAGPVRAEDGEGGDSPEALQAKIKAQMEKVIRLMRENQQALLEASLGSGKKPEGAEVKPPDTPEAPPSPSGEAGMAGGDPGMGGGSPPPGGEGDDVRRKIEELIRTTQATGGAIPNELEELVRMIPTQGGGGGGGDGSDPSSGNDPRRDLPNPDEPQPSPQDGKKEGDPPKPDGEKPPPDAEKGTAPEGGPPAWFTSLPDTVRRAIVTGKTDDIPPKYRARIEMYRKWLAKQAHDRK